MLAAAEIRAGDAELVVAGGMESMNGAPYLLPGRPVRPPPRQRRAHRRRPSHDGLWCAIEDCHMGTHAERVAISDAREPRGPGRLRPGQPSEGDRRHRCRAVRCRDGAGDRPRRQGPRDRRRPTTRVRAATRRPRRWPGSSRHSRCPTARTAATPTTGTVTAGNAPGITDGAAATVVASERAVERLGLTPLARIVGYAQAEVAPKWLFLAPIQGVRRLLDRIELPIEAFDLIEINEAFAAQTLADGRALGFDWDRVNVNGGAIALGHPIGASGARIVATLLHELARREGRLWPRHALSWRRRLGRDGSRTGLTARRTLAAMTETAVETPTFRNFIAGEWCDSTSGETFESRNPADTRDVIGRFQQGPTADVAMADPGRREALPDVAPDAGAEARRDPVRVRRADGASTRSASRAP